MMFSTLFFFAIFVPSTPPPPPAPSTQVQQANCEYSAKVGGTRSEPVYQCFSQAEWDARNAQIAAQQAQQNRDIAAYWASVPGWWLHNWWKVLLTIIGVLAALIALSELTSFIDRKRNPYKYDEYGNKKDWYL